MGSRYIASLQYPDYRNLWASTVFSHSSAWALIVARAALVFEHTGSSAWTGAVTFAAMIPAVVMSPLGGFMSDRFDRRTVLAWSYTLQVCQTAFLGVLVVTGLMEPWHVLLLSIFNGSVRAVGMPAQQALVPNTVRPQHIINAVSLLQAAHHGSRFLGPFLILILLWSTGPWLGDNEDWVFFLCTALYAVALGLLFRIRTRSRGVVESGAGAGVMYRNMVAGLRYMYHHGFILAMVLLVVAHCAMTMSFESLFPVISRNELGMESGANVLGSTSYLMVAYGIGALVTALAIAGVQSERPRGRLFLWLGVLSGLTPVALALSPNLELAMLSAAGMGSSQAGFMTLSAATIQSIVPDRIRGRLLGVYTWHIQGFMASFNLVNGSLGTISTHAAPLILGVGGVAFVLVMGMSFAVVHLRRLYAVGVPAELKAT